MIKYIYFFFLLQVTLFGSDDNFEHFINDTLAKTMSVTEKKERFYHLLVPAIEKVHDELIAKYIRVKKNSRNYKQDTEFAKLKKEYKVKTTEELLLALKPHPQSIVIAQAAMESAWGSSRFFREAKNVFGMWSKNPEEPRIAAGIKRNGNYTVWLRKFDTIEDSVRAYYKLMGRGKHFKEFRQTRYETDDVFKILEKLDKYSEIGHLYADELASMIRFNKLQKYDK